MSRLYHPQGAALLHGHVSTEAQNGQTKHGLYMKPLAFAVFFSLATIQKFLCVVRENVFVQLNRA